MGYSPWGHKELDTTEQLTLSLVTYDLLDYHANPVEWDSHLHFIYWGGRREGGSGWGTHVNP